MSQNAYLKKLGSRSMKFSYPFAITINIVLLGLD